MNRQLIEERFEALDNEIKSRSMDLELVMHTDLIPTVEEKERVRNVIEGLGLKLNDFQYTGFNVYPYRYYKEIVMVDVMDMSKEHLIFIGLIERFQKFREHCIQLLEENDFSSFFDILDKRIRMDAFEIFYQDIPMNEKYGIFRSIFFRMEYGFNELEEDFLNNIFTYRKFSDDWHEAMKELGEEVTINEDDTITIYRGVASKSQHPLDAYSWTLSKDTAQWFADRFNSNGDVFEGEIPIEEVLDYITNRNEKEILIKPNTIKNLRRVET